MAYKSLHLYVQCSSHFTKGKTNLENEVGCSRAHRTSMPTLCFSHPDEEDQHPHQTMMPRQLSIPTLNFFWYTSWLFCMENQRLFKQRDPNNMKLTSQYLFDWNILWCSLQRDCKWERIHGINSAVSLDKYFMKKRESRDKTKKESKVQIIWILNEYIHVMTLVKLRYKTFSFQRTFTSVF